MLKSKSLMKLIKVASIACFLSTTNMAFAENAFYTLGTMGGPATIAERSQPSNLLIVDGQKILVDVGDGTAGQLAKIGQQADGLDMVFISHLHFDHTGGLFAILGLRTQTNAREPLQIYGPIGTKRLVAGLLSAMEPSLEAGYGNPNEPKITPESIAIVHEISADTPLKFDNFDVQIAENNHYSFAPGTPGFDNSKSLSFRFNLDDRSIVYSGDTGPSAAVEKLANGADLFIAEMMDVDATIIKIRKLAPNMPEKQLMFLEQHLKSHHLTPADLGIMAKNSNVKRLVVTHFSPGYTDEKLIAPYIATIKEQYNGPVEFAADTNKY